MRDSLSLYVLIGTNPNIITAVVSGQKHASNFYGSVISSSNLDISDVDILCFDMLPFRLAG